MTGSIKWRWNTERNKERKNSKPVLLRIISILNLSLLSKKYTGLIGIISTYLKYDLEKSISREEVGYKPIESLEPSFIF